MTRQRSPATMPAAMAAATPLILLLACGGCRRPEPPPTEKKPEPQAVQLQDTLRQSIDKARDAGKAVHDNAEKQQAVIDTES